MRPLVQGCTPLAPERKDPSLARETMLPSLFLSLCFCTVFFRIPLLLFVSRHRRGACDQQPGTRRGLLLAPGTGASALTFRTIRELPVSLLRGVASKTTPRDNILDDDRTFRRRTTIDSPTFPLSLLHYFYFCPVLEFPTLTEPPLVALPRCFPTIRCSCTSSGFGFGLNADET